MDLVLAGRSQIIMTVMTQTPPSQQYAQALPVIQIVMVMVMEQAQGALFMLPRAAQIMRIITLIAMTVMLSLNTTCTIITCHTDNDGDGYGKNDAGGSH